MKSDVSSNTIYYDLVQFIISRIVFNKPTGIQNIKLKTYTRQYLIYQTILDNC